MAHYRKFEVIIILFGMFALFIPIIIGRRSENSAFDLVLFHRIIKVTARDPIFGVVLSLGPMSFDLIMDCLRYVLTRKLLSPHILERTLIVLGILVPNSLISSALMNGDQFLMSNVLLVALEHCQFFVFSVASIMIVQQLAPKRVSAICFIAVISTYCIFMVTQIFEDTPGRRRAVLTAVSTASFCAFVVAFIVMLVAWVRRWQRELRASETRFTDEDKACMLHIACVVLLCVACHGVGFARPGFKQMNENNFISEGMKFLPVPDLYLLVSILIQGPSS